MDDYEQPLQSESLDEGRKNFPLVMVPLTYPKNSY